MAVTQRAAQLQPDAAPLWLPRHDAEVVDQSASRPPDFVEGYTRQDRLVAMFLGSRWKIVTNVATVLAVLLYFSMLPSFFDAGIGGLIKTAFYQTWTLGLLLLVTIRVRSVSIGLVAKYWLAGLFPVYMLTHYVNVKLLADVSAWVANLVAIALLALPLAAAVMIGRRGWRQPGLTDLMILGFAVGAGAGFHGFGAVGIPEPGGLQLNTNLFVPTISRFEGVVAMPASVVTAIVGLIVGLMIMHRRQAAAMVGAALAAVAVLGDAISIGIGDDTLDWMRQLLINGSLVALTFVAGIIAATLLDHRRLAAIGARDHLFPSDRAHGALVAEEDDDIITSFIASRYRRLRNGVYNTVDATAQQWPPRCEAHPAPVAELSRLGRAAGIAVGPGTSSSGWAPDPDTADSYRFVGPRGFTAYVAGENPIVTAPSDFTLIDLDAASVDPEVSDEALAKLKKEAAKQAKAAKQAAASVPSTASLSAPSARSEAIGSATRERDADYWQYVGVGVVAVAVYVLVRLFTAGDPAMAEATGFFMSSEQFDPPLIRGLLGAIAAAVALRGRDAAVLGQGWEVGPGDDPRPDRPDECEA